MIHVYLLNEGSRAAAYGIGTYVRQMMECLQGLETVTLHVVNLSSDEKESVVKNEKEVEMFYVPSIPPVFSGYNKRYIRHAWFLIRQFIRTEKDDRLIFHLNYYQEYFLISCIREVYPDSRIFFTVHFQEWCFQIFGNTTYYKEILHRKKEETLKTDKERMICDLYDKEQILFKETDKVICLARYTYALMREEYGIPEEKLVLIHNGLKDEYVPLSPKERLSIRKKLFFKDNEKIILFAGRLDEIKGLDYLIQAFKILSSRMECRLVIIGDGDYNIYLKKCKGYWNRITFTGRIEKKELYRFYQIADVGVMPSFHEQCSYVAIEMMMFDVPMIISTTTGLNEMLDEDECKISIEEQEDGAILSVEELAGKIEQKLLQKNCGYREIYLQKYEISSMKQNIRSLYES